MDFGIFGGKATINMDEWEFEHEIGLYLEHATRLAKEGRREDAAYWFGGAIALVGVLKRMTGVYQHMIDRIDKRIKAAQEATGA